MRGPRLHAANCRKQGELGQYDAAIFLIEIQAVLKRVVEAQSKEADTDLVRLQHKHQAYRLASEGGIAAANERRGSGQSSPTLAECSTCSFLSVEFINQV